MTQPDRPMGRADIVFRRVGEEWLLFDADRQVIHVLNLTAALIWSLCDGRTTALEIAREVEKAFGDASAGDAVSDAIERFRAEGLLEEMEPRHGKERLRSTPPVEARPAVRGSRENASARGFRRRGCLAHVTPEEPRRHPSPCSPQLGASEECGIARQHDHRKDADVHGNQDEDVEHDPEQQRRHPCSAQRHQERKEELPPRHAHGERDVEPMQPGRMRNAEA